MSIYAKLNKIRLDFHKMPLKKSGYNSYSSYNYFELKDILPPALELLDKYNMSALPVTFTDELASLTVVDIDDVTGERITITSPMASASLKACHEIQNLGAVQTYQRRYLWVLLLEVLENDVLDSGHNPPAEEIVKSNVSVEEKVQKTKTSWK